MEYDDELAAVAELPSVGHALSIIEDEINKRERAVDSRIFAMLGKGEPLDPQTAVQAWYEKKAIRDLKAGLRRRQTAGQSSGRAVADALNG